MLAVVLLLLFGPKRLPELGRSLGHGMREFKDSLSALDSGDRSPSGPTPEKAGALPAPREHDAV